MKTMRKILMALLLPAVLGFVAEAMTFDFHPHVEIGASGCGDGRWQVNML